MVVANHCWFYYITDKETFWDVFNSRLRKMSLIFIPPSFFFFKFQLYKNSTQYKDIAAKYELTEGPWPHYQGLKVMRANNNYHEFLVSHCR